MSAALAPAFILAAVVLVVAGVGKLRAPAGAAAAIGIGPGVVRVLAVGEVALGVACLLWPGRALAAALALAYALFAGVAGVLRRRRVACGCFGENDIPVSAGHVVASALLGMLAVAAAVAGPRGFDWVVGHSPATEAVLLVGIAGAAYGVVLVYTVVPRAWGAWERA